MKTPVRSVLAISCLFIFVMSGVFAIAQFEWPVIRADAQTPWPSDRSSMPIVYDTESDRTILFGGWNKNFESLGDTWAYDLNTNSWENMSPTSAPSKRSGHAFAYDSGSDRAILFSGHKSGGAGTLENWNETWAYDYNTNTWNDLAPTQMPSPRLAAPMVYDSESDVCILFGGIPDGGGFFGDTWAYDYDTNNWTNMDPLVSPSSRVAAMVYDIESDRVILFGGGGYETGPLVTYTDTWVYDYNTNTWTEMTPADNPSSIGAMAYDEESDKCVFFGGCLDWFEEEVVAETWTYDYSMNAWTEMSPTQSPSPRSRIAITYDSESDRIIAYSGGQWSLDTESYNIINDLWTYDENADSWEKLYPLPIDLVIIAIIVGSVVIIALAVIYFTKFRKRE